MTSVTLNPSGDDPLQGQNQFFISHNSQDSPTFFNIFDPTQTIEFEDLSHQNDHHHDHQLVLGDGSSSNNHQFSFNSPQPMMEDSSSTRDPTYKMEEEEMKKGHGSAKWMSSKMRLMKKMMRPGSSSSTDKAINTTTASVIPRPRFQYQRHENRYSQRSPRNNNCGNTTIRVCSDCNTSTTPLWRSGPMGPKSLCNACGIRQRKARRAMLESQNGLTTPKNNATTTAKTRVHNMERKPRTNKFSQFKNTKYKPTATTTTTASSSSSQSVDKVETFEMSLKNNSDFEQVLPWDEAAQAALLLMSLSYGFLPIMNNC